MTDNKNTKAPEMLHKPNISNNVASKEEEEEANKKFDENVVATQPLIQEPGWSNAYISQQGNSNTIQEQPIWNEERAPPPSYQETMQTFVQEDESVSCTDCCYLCLDSLEVFLECILICAQASHKN